MPEYCGMPFSTLPVNQSGVRSIKVVGLTGGMGTGKSVVAGILGSLGCRVYNADQRAKALYSKDALLRSAVVELFGSAMFGKDGALDRMALAERVFGDREALTRLNQVVHPAVARDFAAWKEQCVSAGAGVLFKEAAILFESGSNKDCDAVWAVSSPLELRRARVRLRDGWSDAEIDRRLAHQWPAHEIEQRADVVIQNDGNVPLVPLVVRLLTELC